LQIQAISGETLKCHKIRLRSYAPLDIEFYRVGVFYVDSIDKATIVDIHKKEVLGKGVILRYPGHTTATVVALPENILNEGNTDY
jgi:hypothetical protein